MLTVYTTPGDSGNWTVIKLGGYHFMQRPDGLPPLMPVITILYGEGGNGDKIDLRLDLEADKFLLLDMKFLYGGPNSYVPPKHP